MGGEKTKEDRRVNRQSEKVKRLLGCTVQQRVPESERVDEGLNGLEGKTRSVCLHSYDSVCVCVREYFMLTLCESMFQTTQDTPSVTPAPR